MSKNEQSSVDWFWNQIPEILPFTVDTITGMTLHRAYQQAKEMEKEQRISDFRAGIECESDHHGYMWTDKDYPEQWYKDLQGGNND